MDENHVRSLIQQIDEGVPREGAVVVEEPDDHGPILTANRLGYLRLGIEFLKAAFAAPISENSPNKLDLDLTYLTGLEYNRYSFERREDVQHPTPDADTSKGSVVRPVIIVVTIVLFILASLVIGAVTILNWLWALVS